METGEVDVHPANTRLECGDDSFLRELGVTWSGINNQLNSSREDLRRRKFTSSIFEGELQSNSMLELQQKTKKIQGLWLFSLSFSQWYVVSLWPDNAVNSTSIHAFFILANTKKCSCKKHLGS